MIPEGKYRGSWIDEPCAKKNLVVCQRMQVWTIERLQRTLLWLQKMFSERLQYLERNPVPIGFIYTQLPNEKLPTEIWTTPFIKWSDISSHYEGIFFRVSGGDSAPFGLLQQDYAPHIR